MKKKISIAIIAIVALVGVYFVVQYFTAKNETDIVLNLTNITTGNITSEVTATGTVEPLDKVDVGTQVSGRVDKIYVDYNSIVKQGQILAELDKTTLLASVENSQASYNAALSQLNYQKQNYTRQKNMYEAGVISKAEYETAEYSYQTAQTNLKQTSALLQTAKTNLSYATIYSPIKGVILTKEVEEGQTVAASMTTPTLFTIAKDLTKMKVEANVDEADIGNVAVGQRVSFTVDAYPDMEFPGKVKQVHLGSTTTSNVVTYTVIVEVDNSDLKLKPGLTATITIYTKELKDISVVPAQALNFSPETKLLEEYYKKYGISESIPATDGNSEQAGVWVKKGNGALERKPVVIGDKDGINTQILSGLAESDTIVMGMSQEQNNKAGSVGYNASPFMPKRPGGTRKSTAATTK